MTTRKKWLLGGVIVVLVLMLVSAVMLWRLQQKMSHYLEHQPMAIAPVTVTPTQKQTLEASVNDFVAAATNGRAADLNLTVAQINAAFNSFPELARLKGRVEAVEIAQDVIKLKVSLPLNEMGINNPRFDGMYLNGTLSLRGTMTKDGPQLRVVGVERDGEPAPNLIVSQLSDRELVGQLQAQYPETAPFIKRVRRFDLKNGELTVEMAPK